MEPVDTITAVWTVEGVVKCPGECGLYFDFDGTPSDLVKFVIAHRCTQEREGLDQP